VVEIEPEGLEGFFEFLFAHLDEKQRRLWLVAWAAGVTFVDAERKR
jgi:hypothetical protein